MYELYSYIIIIYTYIYSCIQDPLGVPMISTQDCLTHLIMSGRPSTEVIHDLRIESRSLLHYSACVRLQVVSLREEP